MSDNFGYTDPWQQAAEAQQPFIAPSLTMGQPPWSAASAPAVGPLDGLQDQVAGVLNAADSHNSYIPGPGGGMLQYPRGRQPSLLGDMIKGALLGFGSWYVWQRMKKRRAVKAEYTSPGFRALGLLLVFPAVGFALSTLWVPESGYFLGWGCALGAASFTVYAIYRATGHGRYNSRRRGSRWRDDHRHGGHQAW